MYCVLFIGSIWPTPKSSRNDTSCCFLFVCSIHLHQEYKLAYFLFSGAPPHEALLWQNTQLLFLRPFSTSTRKGAQIFLLTRLLGASLLSICFGHLLCNKWPLERTGYGYLAGQFDNCFLLFLCGKCSRSKVLVQKAFSFVIFSSSFICLGFTVTFTWCISTNHGVVFFFFFALKKMGKCKTNLYVLWRIGV